MELRYFCDEIMSLKTLLIEDEAPAMDALRTVIKENCKDLNIVGEASNIQDAYRLIKEAKPELVISDIELEDKTIFDLLEHLKDIDFKIIFQTGHNAYAIKAFKMCAIDYLMKPINEFELIEAIERAKKSIDSELLQVQIKQLQQQISGNKPKKIIFKTADQIKLVAIEDIIQLKASGSYTEVYINGEGMLMVSGNLKEYESLLDGANFFRSHQSHLVNLNHFDYFHKGEGGYLVMNNKSTVPISAKKKNDFLKLIEQL